MVFRYDALLKIFVRVVKGQFFKICFTLKWLEISKFVNLSSDTDDNSIVKHKYIRCFHTKTLLVLPTRDGSLNCAEKTANKLLSKYGDITTELKNYLLKLDQNLTSKNQEIKIQEEINQHIISNENKFTNQMSDLFTNINNLRENLSNYLSIDYVHVDNNNVQINNLSMKNILNDIKNMENQLQKWDNLFNNYSPKKIHIKVMNIPHSVSEDLSFIENALEHEDNISIKDLEEEINTFFKKLSTLLNFNGVVQDILDLTKAAKAKDNEALDQLLIIENLPNKEKKLKELKELANTLIGLLKDLKSILSDLNIKTLSEIDNLIQANEKEIEEYSQEIFCYSQFLENCHYKGPSDLFYLPECMRDCNKK